MKQFFYVTILAFIVLFFSLGFQCGSPELTSAKLYIQQKNWDKALEAAEKEVKNNPKSVEGWFVLGNIKGEKKDWKGMVAAFDECLKLDPVTHKKEIENKIKYEWAQAFNSGVSNFNKAKENKEAGKKAISDFNTAIILQPDSLGSYWNLAFSYQAIDDKENALKTYESIAAKRSDYNAYLKLGDMYVEKGNNYKTKFDSDNKEKIELVNKLDAIEKKVSKETVRKNLGEPDEIKKPQADVQKGKDAKKKPAKKTTDDQKEEWIYKKYNLHISFDKDLVTEKKFDPAYKVNIDSTEYFSAVKEYTKSIEWYNKAKDVAPDSIKLNILDALTKLYISTNQLDVAVRNYEILISKDPKNENYHYTLGVLYLNSKRFDDAISCFKKVIEIKPDDERSYYNLFAVFNNWAIKMKDEASVEKEDTTYMSVLRQGFPYIKKLHEMKPENLDYIDPLRQMCALFQDKAELEKLFTKMKELEVKEGNNPHYWEILGKLYLNLNKFEDSKKAYEKADQLRKQK
jgi:tetratricopeptide (TPR) repeat protein